MYSYNQAIPLLIQRFPGVKKVYGKNIDDYIGLPYVLYESVFTKEIINIITSSQKKQLKPYFDFIEEMLTNGDDAIKNLIEVAVIESLYFEAAFREAYMDLREFFGLLTEKSFKNCTS